MTALSFVLPVWAPMVMGDVTPAPVPEVAFVLQLGAVSAAIGSGVALRPRARDADVDAWRITTAWGTLGLIVGAVVVLALTL